ncbi:MAG: DUF3822 family protein [Bacteroidales bacterium]|nr:DUF3822 family protein [Bacteroidales bacterium]MBQ9702264.1 DUF3822 family protein [Bacteroidales bacterium]
MSGYSFKVYPSDGLHPRAWRGPETLFTTPEFQHRYDKVDISLLTPKVCLVPEVFFDPQSARGALSEVCPLQEGDFVETMEIPSLASVLVFSNSIGENLSKVMAQTVLPTSGEPVRVLPEMYYLLSQLDSIQDYNKIVASWAGEWLHLVIAQGKSLRLANVFRAPDFTTAQYFLFLSLKQLQLNPEVSTVCFRTPLDSEASMSLYRYFKGVVQL